MQFCPSYWRMEKKNIFAISTWHGGRICPYLIWGCTCPAEGGGRGAADPRGECDSTLFCVAGAIVLEVGKDRFPAVIVSSNILVKQLPRCSACFPRRSGCHFVTCISSVFQDVLHATLQQPFQATSKTFCVLRCNNLFNQLPT